MLIPLSSNITEAFKTPGKLRGKPPHTARKVNAVESRMVGLLERPFFCERYSHAQRLASLRRLCSSIAKHLEKSKLGSNQPVPSYPPTASSRVEDGTDSQTCLPTTTCILSSTTSPYPRNAGLWLLWEPGFCCHGSE